MRNFIFRMTCLFSLLRNQLNDFESSTRYEFRFIVFAGISFLVWVLGRALASLPTNTIEVLISNLFTPVGYYTAVLLGYMALLTLFLGIKAKNIARTL